MNVNDIEDRSAQRMEDVSRIWLLIREFRETYELEIQCHYDQPGDSVVKDKQFPTFHLNFE